MAELASFLPIVAIAALFWLLIIRPASRRQKELSRMQSSLSVGDEVMLTSGIFATVEDIEDDHVRVRVADGVVLKVARGAIGTIVRPEVVSAEPEEA
ncbi:preprotein translocase subunit YajC [Nocardioides pantholopis]|uniref:preprotein translocase subunit YajC n=1 Tax=Nocardioides pantholopis TaxID=2483798 RepID=UPI001F14D76E|nr:preprotein translocase subunit YajC [Nocardioides pantholopis]